MSIIFDGDIGEIAVTQTKFGKYIGLSQQKISQMLAAQELIRDETDKSGRVMLAASLREYYLSKRGATGDNVNYWTAKAQREDINRQIDALKLAKMRGEVYDAETVESVLVELLTNFRNKLTGLPAKYSTQLEGKTRGEIYDLLTTAIEEELTELSEGVAAVDFAEERASD